MMKYLSQAFFSALFLSQACVCHAQDEIQLQFVSFPRDAVSGPMQLLVGDGRTIEVVMPTNNLSPVYAVPKLSQWVLGKNVTDDTGVEKFETHGRTPALGSSKQLVLVLPGGEESADGLTLTPFNLEQEGFTGGSYLFFNASRVEIAVTVGDLKFAIRPLSHRLEKPKPSNTSGERERLYTHFFFREGDEAIPFYSSTWRFSDNTRSMVFFYHNTLGGQLRTHSIRDYLP